MKTAHVLAQLPLWVEGDLAEGEASAVQAHLAQCPTCFAAAETLKESQVWLKAADAPAFTYEDRRRLRLEVMARIQAEPLPKRRGARLFLRFRPVLLMTAALGLILVVKGFHRSQPEPLVLAGDKIQLQPTHPEPLHGPPPVMRTVPPRSARQRPPGKQVEAAVPAEASLSRIEFQTGNPQIRIIWLARAEGVSAEPHPFPDRPVDPL